MQLESESDIEPGRVLAGKFRIEQVLGRGGMGVVVAATHLQLDERVALKFLLPEALANPETVKRFEREARAAVKIKSEHVARVTDVGQLENGSPYMVMEFLNGMDLGAYLERMGPLPVSEAVSYLTQACEAIAEAHSLGIIHRDLKPANLFRIIRSDGSASIKVLDFGISKVTTGAEAAMTHTSSMMGSPYYMSPEQMTSAKNVDARADIWALGIILHELLTGKVPYDGDTIPEVCARVLQNEPPAVREFRDDVPIEVERVIARALAKDRSNRFAHVADFTGALAPFGGDDAHRSVDRISRVLGVVTTQRGSLSEFSDERGLTGPQRQESTLGGAAHTQTDYAPPTTNNRPLLLSLLLVLLAGGVGAWVALYDSTPPEAPGLPVASEASALSGDEGEGAAAAKTTETPPGEAPGKDDSQAETEPRQKAPPTSSEPPSAKLTSPTASRETAPQLKAVVQPAPATPRPTAAPAPRPAPAPQPAPTVRPPSNPKPADPSSLYLDRK